MRGRSGLPYLPWSFGGHCGHLAFRTLLVPIPTVAWVGRGWLKGDDEREKLVTVWGDQRQNPGSARMPFGLVGPNGSGRRNPPVSSKSTFVRPLAPNQADDDEQKKSQGISQ